MLISGLKVKIHETNGMSFALRGNLSSCFSYMKIKKNFEAKQDSNLPSLRYQCVAQLLSFFGF